MKIPDAYEIFVGSIVAMLTFIFLCLAYIPYGMYYHFVGLVPANISWLPIILCMIYIDTQKIKLAGFIIFSALLGATVASSLFLEMLKPYWFNNIVFWDFRIGVIAVLASLLVGKILILIIRLCRKIFKNRSNRESKKALIY